MPPSQSQGTIRPDATSSPFDFCRFRIESALLASRKRLERGKYLKSTHLPFLQNRPAGMKVRITKMLCHWESDAFDTFLFHIALVLSWISTVVINHGEPRVKVGKEPNMEPGKRRCRTDKSRFGTAVAFPLLFPNQHRPKGSVARPWKGGRL
jgi:hypothetical protein